MAKTKLFVSAEIAYSAIIGELDEVLDSYQRLQPLSPEKRARVEELFRAAEDAARALEVHLNNLKRREDAPTVKDRIRNLKNVFKDKVELHNKREEFRGKLADHYTKLEDLRVTTGVQARQLEAVYQSFRIKRAKDVGTSSGSIDILKWQSGPPQFVINSLKSIGYSDSQNSSLMSSKSAKELAERFGQIEKESAARLSRFEKFLDQPIMANWTPQSSATSSLRGELQGGGWSSSEVNEFLSSKDLKGLKDSVRKKSELSRTRSARFEEVMSKLKASLAHQG